VCDSEPVSRLTSSDSSALAAEAFSFSVSIQTLFRPESVIESVVSHSRLCVCFFVFCTRHWFNRVSAGIELGVASACLPTTLALRLAMPKYP
jgi:hypothetical protein